MAESGASKALPRPIGLVAVIEELKLRTPVPAVRSSVVAGARRTRIENETNFEQYPKTYATNNLYENLKFAMRYEPIDLGVLQAAFAQIAAEDIKTWVSTESTGIYARKIWYLYELLTGEILDLQDVAPTGYVDLLNPKLQLTASSTQIRRQRINDNLLGNRTYCPLIRLTDRLKSAMAEGLDKEAREIVEGSDPLILARAIRLLVHKGNKIVFRNRGRGGRKIQG